jgi:hypothetical protein
MLNNTGSENTRRVPSGLLGRDKLTRPCSTTVQYRQWKHRGSLLLVFGFYVPIINPKGVAQCTRTSWWGGQDGGTHFVHVRRETILKHCIQEPTHSLKAIDAPLFLFP